MRYKLCAFIFIFLSYNYCDGQQFYSIPKETIDPFKILGASSTEFGYWDSKAPTSMKLDMAAFEISTQITYGQYKEYLKAIKKDSSANFYLSQLPDTTMCLPEIYKEYTWGNAYDDFPIMGIRWDAAMNYCKWMTIRFNKGIVRFIFRLPCESEWLDAYNCLHVASIKNDFNQNYSDWLLNMFDEDSMNFVKTTSTNHWSYFDYICFADKKGPNVLKRKSVIGDSYLFKMETLADYSEIRYYSYQGYRQVGFRVLKESIDTNAIIDLSGKQRPSIDSQILKSWGLK